MSIRRVLIICTGNSARSQMAEALWRHLGGGAWEVHSAGSRPTGAIHPLAAQVMAEIGLDLAGQHSKPLAPYLGQPFDVVVTVCAAAARDCPLFPGARKLLHWPYDDPAAAGPGAAEQLAAFRRVRDELRVRIADWLRLAAAGSA